MTNARRDCKCGYCVNYFLDKPNRAKAPPPADSPAMASLKSAVDDLRSVGVDAPEPFRPLPTGPEIEGRTDSYKDLCLKTQARTIRDYRLRYEEAEKALTDRIASEPGRFNAASAIYQKRAQQAEAQRDMSNAACADAQRALTAAYADLAYANCTIEALTKDAPASQPVPPVGSIVTVKSGGPRMTIAEDQGGKAMCRWWAGQFFATGLFEYAGLATLPN